MCVSSVTYFGVLWSGYKTALSCVFCEAISAAGGEPGVLNSVGGGG